MCFQGELLWWGGGKLTITDQDRCPGGTCSAAQCPSWRHPCESTVKEKQRCSGRARESAQCVMTGHVVRTSASRLVVPALRRTGHPFAASGLYGHRRRLSECSLPVPKQLEESLGSAGLLRSVGNRRDLAVCASMILFLFPQPVFTRPRSPAARPG